MFNNANNKDVSGVKGVKDVIIALDFPDAAKVYSFLDRFTEVRPFVKVGMELFYAQGPELVSKLTEQGYKVFLDLKLHDIPNTVKRAMERLAGLGVHMVNLHAAGGSEMMKYALEGLTDGSGTRPILIAVTQLTSTGADMLKNELLIDRGMEETVLHYADVAKSAGLDGVVCSPLESAGVKAHCGSEFLTVTPGIRFADSGRDDQKRITTPAGARQLGSDYIVVGRPITAAEDPLLAYNRCRTEFLGELV